MKSRNSIYNPTIEIKTGTRAFDLSEVMARSASWQLREIWEEEFQNWQATLTQTKQQDESEDVL